MATLSKRYKKYAVGGFTDAEMATGIGQAGSLVGSLTDSLGPADQYGKRTMGANLVSSVGKGAAMGANFGPLGAGIGAGAGLIAGFLSNKSQAEQASRLKNEEQRRNTLLNQQQASARIATDPTLVRGNTATLMNGYYAAGGPLNVSNQQTEGGTATPLNSQAAEFNGPPHEQGGIQIPGMGAEVEGNETTNGSYVFSDRLGFAALHKPIAKAIGKIEHKPLSPERVNSLKLLKEKENQLKLSQEYTKHMLGLN
jgi:hypothetical protein